MERGIKISKEKIEKIKKSMESKSESIKLIGEWFTLISEECKIEEKKNIFWATILTNSKPDEMDLFIDKGICPPLFYICDKLMLMNVNEAIDYTLSEDISELILSEEIKEYYIDNMKYWIEKEDKTEYKSFIEEIKCNLKQNNLYVTTLSLFVLLEHKINNVIDKNEKLIIKNSRNYIAITSTIKNVLEKNCFKYDIISSQKLNRIYDEFVPKYYESTEKDLQRITRHMLHGKRLDLINEEEMMSLIFFVDCIYKMLFIK